MEALIMSKEKRQQLIRRLHNHRFRIIMILILYPNIVCFTPDASDSSNTFIDFMLGLGKYSNVTYNCRGHATSIQNYSYVDYGALISHRIGYFKFGIRGGGFSLSTNQEYTDYFHYENELAPSGTHSVEYINPFIAFEDQYAELNLGVLFSTNYPFDNERNERMLINGKVRPTAKLRMGNIRAVHFSTQFLSNVPIFSGGGEFDVGVGFGSIKSRNITWLGLSWMPYQNIGLAFKQNIDVSETFEIMIKGRIGQIESTLEGSISAGARYNF
jgi:hypothetical protein